MTTYRDINATGDTTLWLRDEATGLVTNKPMPCPYNLSDAIDIANSSNPSEVQK